MRQHCTPIPNHCCSHTGLLIQCPGLSLTSANFCPLSNVLPSPLGTFSHWEQLLAIQGTWIPFPPSQLGCISSQARENCSSSARECGWRGTGTPCSFGRGDR